MHRQNRPPATVRRALLSVLVLGPIMAGSPISGVAQVSDHAGSDTAAKSPGSTLVPVPILFSSPETGTGFGAAATYLFRLSSRLDPNATRTSSPSSVSAVAIYTSKKQIVTSIEPVLRLRGDRLRLKGVFEYVKFPTTFWGIGNETDDGLEEDYTAEAVNIEGEILWGFRRGWYWGLGARFAKRRLLNTQPSGLLHHGLRKGCPEGLCRF